MTTVPVVYASDNNYIVPTIVSITSLLINKSKNTFYNIFILTNNLSDEKKIKFVWPDYKDEYELDFFSVDLKELETIKAYGTWTSTIYAKYFISDLLKNYNKCLWLDSDTIIQQDLVELFTTNLNDNLIGAVKSPGMNYNIAAGKQPWLEIDREKSLLKCFNVGMLLLDLKKLRELGGCKYFFDNTLSAISNLSAGTIVTEQDMFNKLLIGRVEYLPLKYNFYINNKIAFANRHYYPFCFDRKTIEEAFDKPVIIHYAVIEKPWIYSNVKNVYAYPYRNYGRIWDAYFKLSPLSRKKLKKRRLGLIKCLKCKIKPSLIYFDFFFKIKKRFRHQAADNLVYDFFD
jgi:lipopolysaccharide biosynthesis glycosyltransferase